MGVLKVLEGDVPGRIVVLNREKMVLGRHPDCQIVVDNAAVSRRHVQFLENHGTYYVEDLQSRNGTLLNGNRIEGRTELREADLVKVCDILFRFHSSQPQQQPTSGEAGMAAETQFVGNETKRVVLSDAPETTPANETDDSHESVISTLDASSVTSISLDVRPEAKLSAVLAISREMGATIEVEQMLPRILECLFQILPQTDRGIVLLRDEKSSQLLVKAVKARNAADEDSAPVSRAIIDRAAETRQAFLSADAGREFDASESIANFKIHSLMCAPLVGHSKEMLGVIQLDSRTTAPGFKPADLEILATVACQAALLVERSVLFEQAGRLRDLQRELDFATQIQLGFLPTKCPYIPGYEFFHYYEPAKSVGGDFFDYVSLPDGRLAVTQGDVAGKGVPAALMMARLYSDARSHLLTERTIGGAMAKLNNDVVRGGHGHRFVTYAGMILNPTSHELTFANAGHLPPLLRSADGTVKRLGVDHANLPLGVDPDLGYEEIAIELAPGDTIALYTDGVTEANNTANELYGMQRLCDDLAAAPDNVNILGEMLISKVEQFCEHRPQRDDICLLCFRRLPESDIGTV